MNLFGVMNVSSSALKAERVRAEVVASNMANAETTRTPEGGPYQRHHVVFQAEDGGSQGFQHSLISHLGGNGLPSLSGRSLFANVASESAPGGVAVTGVIADNSAPLRRFDPEHPDAGPDGYVSYPDINPLTEMVDLMGATRSYGMNTSAIQAEKGMISSSLDILKS
jgi:flagellar basal-body rod protein FlgC